jgi:prepilin-type N-terminal cleavage/methylation domain-containing protein
MKAFTLFEVLVSLLILASILSGATKLFKSSNNIEIYYDLIDLQNSFDQYHTVKDDQNIKFIPTLKEK